MTATELIDRGWARQWLEPLLGAPRREGSAKLWSRRAAIEVEAHPLFIEACSLLGDLAKRVRYVTKEHELAALGEAKARFDSGQLPAAGPVALDVASIASAAPQQGNADFLRAEWTADALLLIWECGGRAIIPLPFLEALRRGLGESIERLRFAVDTVITDWRLGRIKPEKFQYGRNYLLGAVRNTLAKLQALERPAATRDDTKAPEAPAETPPKVVLH
jgi:hypothetical protein